MANASNPRYMYILYRSVIIAVIIDLCLGGHGVLLNSKLNHIDLRSASVNMIKFTV